MNALIKEQLQMSRFTSVGEMFSFGSGYRNQLYVQGNAVCFVLRLMDYHLSVDNFMYLC